MIHSEIIKDCDPNSSLAAKEVLIKTVEIENIPVL
jgi:hypothetical protein